MTCIVGLIDEERNIWMGGDSAGVAGSRLFVRSDEKVFINGPMIMGFTSSFRMGQLLRYALEIPYHRSDCDDYKYMVIDFINAVRTCFSKHGFLKKKDEAEEAGSFLVGYKGKIYKIEDDLQVAESIYNYDACGCGEGFALASMSTIKSTGSFQEDPEGAIRLALSTAEQYSGWVRGPYNILKLGYNRKQMDKEGIK